MWESEREEGIRLAVKDGKVERTRMDDQLRYLRVLAHSTTCKQTVLFFIPKAHEWQIMER